MKTALFTAAVVLATMVTAFSGTPGEAGPAAIGSSVLPPKDSARGGGAPGAPRVLTVTVVTDREFREWPQWRGMSRRVLAEATAGMDTLAGLSFRVVEEIEWPASSDSLTLPETLDRVMAEVKPKGDILWGIVGIAPRPSHANDLVGYALLGQPFLILEHAKPKAMAMTLRHELGHVFGLPHLPARSVMADRVEYRVMEFDVLCADLLRAVAPISFDADRPFLNCDLDVIRDVYLAWAERGIGRAVLLTDLAVALKREGKPRDALLCLERAVRLNSAWAPAWFHLGQARIPAGDAVGALFAFEQYLILEPAGEHGEAARRHLRDLQ